MRKAGYDYSTPGYYFVTVCTQMRALVLEEERLRREVLAAWLALPRHYKDVRVDAFVVMPNHIHGIVVLDEPVGAGVSSPIDALSLNKETPAATSIGEAGPLYKETLAPTVHPSQARLPRAMRMFKTHSARRVNNWRKMRGQKLWQRGYWEHIIRDERGLKTIRNYIAENPLKWEIDPENPNRPEAPNEGDLWDTLRQEGTLYLVTD